MCKMKSFPDWDDLFNLYIIIRFDSDLASRKVLAAASSFTSLYWDNPKILVSINCLINEKNMGNAFRPVEYIIK